MLGGRASCRALTAARRDSGRRAFGAGTQRSPTRPLAPSSSATAGATSLVASLDGAADSDDRHENERADEYRPRSEYLATASVAVDQDPSAPLALTCLRAADERKAREPLALRVSHLTYACTFLVICTGRSRPQIAAIARNVEDKVRARHCVRARVSSGSGGRSGDGGGWVLLDYGDVIVNVMSPEQRAHYRLESLWSRGERLAYDEGARGGDADAEAGVVPGSGSDDDDDDDDDDMEWVVSDEDAGAPAAY